MSQPEWSLGVQLTPSLRLAGVMRPGHTFTIEPILAETDPDARKWPDRWTYATIDHSWAAQFEHTAWGRPTGTLDVALLNHIEVDVQGEKCTTTSKTPALILTLLALGSCSSPGTWLFLLL